VGRVQKSNRKFGKCVIVFVISKSDLKSRTKWKAIFEDTKGVNRRRADTILVRTIKTNSDLKKITEETKV
jgi:hypothetical protein